MRSQQQVSVLVFTLITIYTIFSISSQAVLATNKSDHSNATHQELILHYDMKSMKESDGQLLLKDISDSNITFDGVLKNQKKEELVSNEEIGFVSFEGGNSTSNSNYIEIRKGNDGSDLLNGLEDVTVSSLVNWDDDGQNRWIYGLGKVAADIENKNSYFFVTPRHSVNDTIATGVSEAGWRNESLVTGKENLTSGEWHVVTSVFSGSNNTLTLYVNGKEVATDSLQGRKLANIIDTTSDFSGFIGKSIFQNDDYFKGSIGDFRVYNYAMNEKQVKSLNNDLSNKINKLRQLAIDDAKVSLDINDFISKHDESAEGVTDNLNLPQEIIHGVKVKWRSSNSKVVSHDGIVTRPRSDKGDQKVELIASLSEGEL